MGLRDCPFCGKQPTIHREVPMGGHHGGGPAYQIIRCECGVRMECIQGYPSETTAEQAARAWNTRTADVRFNEDFA